MNPATELETNPIRVARKRAHKTQDEFAKMAGVITNTLYLNECGIYPTILPKIRTLLVKDFAINGDQLDKEYRKFVLDKRRFFALQYADKLRTLPDPHLSISPLENFRLHIDPVFSSRQKFCKAICVELSGVYRLERKKADTFPNRLKEAFLQIGVPSENITELEERTYEFFLRG